MQQLVFSNLESIFKKYVGAEALTRLGEKVRGGEKVPMILFGGDQLTGKSSISRILCSHFPLGGQFISVGEMFRAHAQRNNQTVAELSRDLRLQLLNPNPTRRVDVELDYATCEVISGFGINGYGVVEGRQPAVMGRFMENRCQKENLVKVLVTCSNRERAVRFIDRQFGKEAATIACKCLPLEKEANYTDLASVGQYIAQLDLPNIEVVAKSFIENQNRDADDRARYMNLYGADYTNPFWYDIQIDTTEKTTHESICILSSKIKSIDYIWNLLNCKK